MRRIIVPISLMLSFAFAAVAATRVTGKVVGPDGAPIVTANVFVWVFSSKLQRLQLVTDKNGEYAFDANLTRQARRATLASVVVFAPGYALAGTYLAETTGNVVTLEPGSDLHGTVVDAAGKPQTGIPVRLRQISMRNHSVYVPEEWNDRFIVMTGADGAWTLPAIPRAATVTVALHDDRYVREQQEITLAVDKPAPDVRFTLRPARGAHRPSADTGGDAGSGCPDKHLFTRNVNQRYHENGGGWQLPHCRIGNRKIYA